MPYSPPERITLPYQADSCALFEQIRGLPYPAFLDSSQHGSELGRFDILCANPSHRLVSEYGRTQLTLSNGEKIELDKPPFEALKTLLIEQGFDGIATPDLPFCGGVLGYFGYDLGRHYEPIETLACHDIELPDMQVGLYPWAIIVDHQKEITTVASHSLTASQLHQLVSDFIPAETGDFRLASEFQSNLSHEACQQRFKRVVDYIQAGDCYQINLAQRFSCEYQGDPWRAYQQLRRQTQTPFSAYLESPAGCILSFSPERFLQVEEGRVQTRPIKGTRPRSMDPNEDQRQRTALQHSAKDRAENLMIVDLLRNDMGRHCVIGSICVPKIFDIESYANVHHLVTTITGTLARPIDAVELLQGCFPGGSITGAPKIRAMQIIEELEPHRRSAYCGTIGYIGFNGQMDSNICIRTLVATRSSVLSASLENEKIHCWAGGGIVADSRCDEEYQETFDKVNNLIRHLEQQFLSSAIA